MLRRRLTYLILPVLLWSCRGDLPRLGLPDATAGFTPAGAVHQPVPAPGALLAVPVEQGASQAQAAPNPANVPAADPAPADVIDQGGDPTDLATESVQVGRVIDGDTFELDDGRRVRMIGINTPERDECGYREAGELLATLIGERTVDLLAGAATDADHYGRLLRYVEIGGRDINLSMIESGRAEARYDSLDGYPYHPRQNAYRGADMRSLNANVCLG